MVLFLILMIKKKRFYFWLLFDREYDFLNFGKSRKKYMFLSIYPFYIQNLLLIDNFLKNYMGFYSINEELSRYNIYDYRTAAYYVGVYSKNLDIFSLLYENVKNLQSGFFPTDLLLYTLSVLVLDRVHV